MDRDPTYTDAWGPPLLRLTFDWHRNDYLLYRYLTERATEIMRAMGASKVAATEGLTPYNLDPYQSTHIKAGAILGDNHTHRSEQRREGTEDVGRRNRRWHLSTSQKKITNNRHT